MSPNTIASYKDAFILLINFMEKRRKTNINKLSLKDFTKDGIVEFLDWLQSERHCCDATRNVRLASLHSFFRYLQYEVPEYLHEWQQILSIREKKAEKGVISYLTMDGIKLLLQQPDPSTAKGLRDLAMFALMYDSGGRVQEILDLTPSGIRLTKPCTVKLVGKGNKARIVPMMEQQLVHLIRFMEKNKLLENNMNLHPLFFNSRKEKLTRAGAHHILQRYASKAREKNPALIPEKISCHSFRHSRAMHLLQAGVHLVYIRDILGHKSVVTTEIYAKVDSKQKREAIEKVYQNLITKEEPVWIQNSNLLEWLKGLK